MTSWTIESLIHPLTGKDLLNVPSHYLNKKITLLSPKEFAELPDGSHLVSIHGKDAIKGKDHIDDDTRYGYLAYGILNP